MSEVLLIGSQIVTIKDLCQYALQGLFHCTDFKNEFCINNLPNLGNLIQLLRNVLPGLITSAIAKPKKPVVRTDLFIPN